MSKYNKVINPIIKHVTRFSISDVMSNGNGRSTVDRYPHSTGWHRRAETPVCQLQSVARRNGSWSCI